MQNLIVMLLLAAAAVFLARRLLRTLAAKDGCARNCGCQQDIKARFPRR
jgi:hypothetical protein